MNKLSKAKIIVIYCSNSSSSSSSRMPCLSQSDHLMKASWLVLDVTRDRISSAAPCLVDCIVFSFLLFAAAEQENIMAIFAWLTTFSWFVFLSQVRAGFCCCCQGGGKGRWFRAFTENVHYHVQQVHNRGWVGLLLHCVRSRVKAALLFF